MELTLDLAGARIHMVHILKAMTVDPAADGIHLVVSGHSHRAGMREKQGVLYVNPGSAGPRRFSLPIILARLTIDEGRLARGFVVLLSLSLPRPASPTPGSLPRPPGARPHPSGRTA